MSSDPTRPAQEWWKQPQGPKDGPEAQGYQGSQQETQRLSRDDGSQETQQIPVNQQFQSYQPYQQPSQPYQQQPRPYQQQQQPYQSPPPYQPSQSYQEFQGMPGSQATLPSSYRRRRRKWPWITLVVIVLLLVGSDRVANAIAENQMASQFQSSLALSGKPHVTIQGIPFWTQLIARNFHQVDINAQNETINASSAGSGLLEIASLTATLHGMHIRGTNSATIDQFNASALITFTALAHAGGVPQGITLSADGPNRVKAGIDLGPISDSITAQITQVGAGSIRVHFLGVDGLPAELGNLADFTIKLPKLPAGVAIQKVSITQQGLRISVTGHNTTLSQ